jgi:hypothetical protein
LSTLGANYFVPNDVCVIRPPRPRGTMGV